MTVRSAFFPCDPICSSAVKYSAVGRMRQQQSAPADPMGENADGQGGLTGKLNEMWAKFLGGN